MLWKFNPRPAGARARGGTAIIAKQSKCSDASFATIAKRDLPGACTVMMTGDIKLFSIYAPQDPSDRIALYKKLTDHVTRKSILGGDFNVILDETLDYISASQNKYSNNQGAEELRTLVTSKGLRDVFREHNPKKKVVHKV